MNIFLMMFDTNIAIINMYINMSLLCSFSNKQNCYKYIAPLELIKSKTLCSHYKEIAV